MEIKKGDLRFGLRARNGVTISPAVLRTLNGKKAVEPISEEHVPSADELEKILKQLPLHCSAAALTIVSSGMRPGETFKLTFDNIDMESYPAKVSFKSSQTKSGKKRWTYLSPQAKQEIEAWLEYRDRFIEKALRYVKADDREAFLKRVDPLIFPFRFQIFQKNWRAAVEKAGLLKIDESTSRLTIRPHNLRKFFSTYGKWPDRDIPQFLMGHVSALRAVYVRYDRVEESVREAYIAAIPSLTVGEGFGDTEAVQKLEKKIEDIQEEKQEVSDDVHYVLKMNKALSAEVDELRAQVNSMDEQIKHLVKWMDQEINSRAVLLSGGTDETIHEK